MNIIKKTLRFRAYYSSMIGGSLKVTKNGKDVYMTPPQGVDHKYTLIFMHGLGDCADSFIDVFQYPGHPSPFPINTKVIILNAPQMKVTINFGMLMNSWYDVSGLGADLKDRYSKEDVKKNSERVRKIMQDQIEGPLKGDSSKLWIGGFSQGACMALNVGLGHQKPVGGIIACSGALFDVTEIKNQDLKKQKQPIFTYHGEMDFMVPYKLARQSYERIKEFKHFVHLSHKSMGHSIDMQELKEMTNFVQKYLE